MKSDTFAGLKAYKHTMLMVGTTWTNSMPLLTETSLMLILSMVSGDWCSHRCVSAVELTLFFVSYYLTAVSGIVNRGKFMQLLYDFLCVPI